MLHAAPQKLAPGPRERRGRPSRGPCRPLVAVLLALALPGCVTQLDYTSWEDGLLEMLLTAIFNPEASLHVLGESSSPGIDQVAIKISHDAANEDTGERNAILFECGMHAREWFAAESCYELLDWLIDNKATATVQELLDHADVWVIPQTNPAGRLIDDQFRGDPTRYALVCKGGADEGDPCTVDADCASNDCYSSGWRTNGNRADCAAGVDLARNFSSGWDSAAASCDPSQFMKFRGTGAFSEPETLNLRKFIHNHMISTVVIVHGNAQQTWNRWASSSLADDFLVDQLAATNLAGVTPDTEATMPRDSVGGGVGQFSAWLTEPSNVAGELDEDTERNISTYFLEVPINGTDYYAGDYNGHDYQFASGDGSNSFHPSSSVWLELWEESIKPMMRDLIRQARSPQCPVDSSGARVTAECEAHDFGLVGAKIAKAVDEPGKLDYVASTREEVLVAGEYEVVFAVQNHGTDPAQTTSNAEVRFFEDGVLAHSETAPISLANGDRAVYSVTYDFPAFHAYRVEIELDGDDFTKDNEKSFAFNTTPVIRIPDWEVIFHEWEIRLTGIDERRPRLVIEGRFVAPDDLVDPQAEIEARLVTYPGWGDRKPAAPRVIAVSTAASRDRPPPEDRSPHELRRPLPDARQRAAILESSIEPIGGHGRATRYQVRLVLDAGGLPDVEASRLVALDLRIGERVRVSGLRSREPIRPKPPNRHRQDDEDEREPE